MRKVSEGGVLELKTGQGLIVLPSHSAKVLSIE
jgi:hypothetical protein